MTDIELTRDVRCRGATINPSILRARGGLGLVGALTLGSIGSGLFLPLSLVFFTSLTTIPLVAVGGILTAANILTIPLPILAGSLADRFGARRFVVAAQLLQAIAFAWFVVARDPGTVFAACALMAIGSRVFWATVFTAIADQARANGDERGDKWFAVANISRTAGIALGGFITGIALAAASTEVYVGIALGSSACMVIAAVLMALLVRGVSRVAEVAEVTDRGRGYRAVFADHPFLRLSGINAVFALSSLFLALSLPTFVLAELSAHGWVAAALLVVNAIVIALFGVIGVRWSRTRPPRRVLQIAGVSWSIGSLTIAAVVGQPLAWALIGLLLGVLLFSAAEILHAPTSMALANVMATASERGRYLAVFQYSFVVADVIGPVLFAGLFSVGHALPFVGLAALNVVAVVLVKVATPGARETSVGGPL